MALALATPTLGAARCAVVARVVDALERLFPSKYAAAWDNVGLLVDAPARAATGAPVTVLLTNDLTPGVLDEAIARRARLIVSYHPTPFSALKRVTLDSVPGRVVLRAAAAGIAVYAPHTAWDAAPDGLNTWLAQGVARHAEVAAAGRRARAAGAAGAAGATDAAAPPSAEWLAAHPAPAVRRAADAAAAAAGYGDGRSVQLAGDAGVTLADVVAAVKRHTGVARVSVALPAGAPAAAAAAAQRAATAAVVAGGGAAAAVDSAAAALQQAVLTVAAGVRVDSLAVCAGSGSGVLPGARAAVFVAGEMGHHDVLAAAAAGTAVVLTGHSNCERGFLAVVRERLGAALAAAPAAAPGEDADVELAIAHEDADPLVSV